MHGEGRWRGEPLVPYGSGERDGVNGSWSVCLESKCPCYQGASPSFINQEREGYMSCLVN